MKTLKTFLLCYILAGSVSAFVVPIEFDQKCAKSDVIVRGVVVNIVQLIADVEDSRGMRTGKNADRNFLGPNAVAIVRITSILKGDSERMSGLIFIPCGYNFDESPSELTKTKEYLFFLHSMGNNYFHPMDPFSMHRIQLERVGHSGFDTDSDFDAKAGPANSVAYDEFATRVRAALDAAKTKKGEQAGADKPTTKPADKDPAKVHASTPAAKDAPR